MSFCASRVVFREFLITRACAYRGRTLIVAKFSSRHYATHRDAPTYPQPGVGSSSLLSQALDQKQKGFRREDSVGPFQLGLSQPSYDHGTAKKWSELSPKGKGQSFSAIIVVTNISSNRISAMRATARTTNLTVILLGAGLTAVLVYALTSELFSRNSPTVLYNEACQRIKSSPRVCNSVALSPDLLKRVCLGREVSTRSIGLP